MYLQGDTTICPKGHPYSGDNLYCGIRKGGWLDRRCKTCNREDSNLNYKKHGKRKGLKMQKDIDLKAENTQLREDISRLEANHDVQMNRAVKAEAELVQIHSENEGLRAELKAIYPHSKCMDLEAKITALMEALEKIVERVNNEGDDSQATVSDIGHYARSALAQAKGGE